MIAYLHPGKINIPSQSNIKTPSTNNDANTLIRTDTFEKPIDLYTHVLEHVRKPEYLEGYHTHTVRTCKAHTESQQARIWTQDLLSVRGMDVCVCAYVCLCPLTCLSQLIAVRAIKELQLKGEHLPGADARSFALLDW